MHNWIRYKGVVYQRIATAELLKARITALKPAMVAAAQRIIDEWQPDEEGIDELYGGGGACDDIAREIQSILSDNGIDWIEGGQEGDDHAWTIAYSASTQEAVGVDIPPGVYESGGGYSWQKHEDVQLEPDDVALFPIPFNDIKEATESDW